MAQKQKRPAGNAQAQPPGSQDGKQDDRVTPLANTRLAVIDHGEANERILNKEEYRADFRKVEGASLKRQTSLASPEAKRMFMRCFYSFQASMYFISQLGRTKLDHDVVEKIEQDVRAALEAGTKELNEAIDQAEALLKHNNIEFMASYDTVPLVEMTAITSSFGRRYFDMMHKLDMIMPMMETLAIEEIITEREHEMRRSSHKRIVLSVCSKARNFWNGVRRRMNEADAKAAAVAAGAGKGAGRAAESTKAPVEAVGVEDQAAAADAVTVQGGGDASGEPGTPMAEAMGAEKTTDTTPVEAPVAAA